jgi:hypothetical protein
MIITLNQLQTDVRLALGQTAALSKLHIRIDLRISESIKLTLALCGLS